MTGRLPVRDEIRSAARSLAADPVPALHALVEIESETGDAAGISRCYAEWAALLPDAVEVAEIPSTSGTCSDLLATLLGTGERSLLLIGHADTVPRAGSRGWHVGDGRAYGRGTYDMKGGLLLMAWVINWLAARPDAYARVSALVVCDEEERSQPVRHRHAEWAMAADACLAFEGMRRFPDAKRRLLVGRYGGGVLTSRLLGEPCRAGLPLDGVNPVPAVAALVAAIEPSSSPEAPVQMIPTRIRMDTPVNVVAAEAELDTVVRFESRDALQSHLEALPVELGRCDIGHSWAERFPPLVPKDGTVSAVARAASILEMEIEPVTSTIGAADACWFADSVPIVIDGLGPLGGGDHGASEFVWTDSFIPCTEVALAVVEACLAG